MKNKKTIFLVTFAVVSFGLLLLLLVLTSCNNKKEISEPNEIVELNSYSQDLSGIPSDINIEDADYSGYHAATNFYYTPNIDINKAFEQIKDYLIFYDGKPVHTDTEMHYDFEGARVTVQCYYPNGKAISRNSPVVQVEAIDGIEFMAATPFEFDRYAIIVDKSTIPSEYDINSLATKVLKKRFITLINPEFDLNYNDSLQTECETWSLSYYMAGNGKYKSIMANVKILDDITVDSFVGPINNTDTYQPNENTASQFEQQFPEEQAPDITNPDNPNYNENHEVVTDNPQNVEEVTQPDTNTGFNLGDTVKKGFEEFKTNFQNNETFKIVTMTCSSILGIALIYVIFLIIRKIWRVIKN